MTLGPDRRRVRRGDMADPLRRLRRTIGTRIRAARNLCGLSQGELGDLLNPKVSYQAIGKFESGRMDAQDRLAEIAAVLHLPVTYFTSDIPDLPAHPEKSSQARAEQAPPSEEAELLRYFAMIPDANLRDRIFELIKAEALEKGEQASGSKGRAGKQKR